MRSAHGSPNQSQKSELRDSPPYTHIQIELSYFNKTIRASETFLRPGRSGALAFAVKGPIHPRQLVDLMHNFNGGWGGEAARQKIREENIGALVRYSKHTTTHH